MIIKNIKPFDGIHCETTATGTLLRQLGLELSEPMMFGLGFLAAAFPIEHYGFWAMFAIGIAGRLASPWISIVVNKHLESQYRATSLSAIALVTRIPYAVIAITAGQLVEQGQLPTFNFTVAGIVFTVSGISLAYVIFYQHQVKREIVN